MLKKINLNSKELILLLFVVLGFLGGLGVGKGLYKSKSEKTPRVTKTETETSSERIYYIEDGETYPEWRKFKNKAVGYSIEYPPESNLVLSDNGEEIFIILEWGGIYVLVFDRAEHLPLGDWVDRYLPGTKRKVIREWNHTVGKQEAYSFTVSGPAGEYQYTFIALDQKVLKIDLGGYLPIPETESQKYAKETQFKMIDTFKLLDY